MGSPLHFALAHKQATACGFRLSYNSDRILATYDPAKVTCEVLHAQFGVSEREAPP